MAHSIRLREPWQCEPLGGEGRGGVKYSRRFHRPTGLEATSRVWLIIEEATADAVVALNGQELGKTQSNSYPARFEITARIEAQNFLEITVLSNEGPGSGLGLVRLEIEESTASCEVTG